MNIILIGMSGAGKSTIGVLLAKALGMDFIDTDIVIQQHAGRLLQKIIDDDGIDAFLKIEAKIVTAMGKTILVVFDIGWLFAAPMTMLLSFSVVKARMIGGWMSGTKDM